MAIVGVIPAAGYATRLQPLDGSKEVFPIGGRPVMDFLVDRMRLAGCQHLRVVTRPEKEDVIAHVEELEATIVLARPASVAESFLAGMKGLDEEDIVLIGFPDTVWEPEDGFVLLVQSVGEGGGVALGLFRALELERCDVVVLGEDGRVMGIDVKPAEPRSEWIWGCAAARVGTLAGLGTVDWPGSYFDSLCREGYEIRGVRLSDTFVDIGTKEALHRTQLLYGSDKD